MTARHGGRRYRPAGATCAGRMTAACAPARPALDLLAEAHARLQEAATLSDPCDRYAAAHVAALRAAAAVLSARGNPPPVARRRPASAWALLPQVAPELAEWAEFFAGNAGRRAAAEAGVRDAATGRQADALVVAVESFLAQVEAVLDLLPSAPARGR